MLFLHANDRKSYSTIHTLQISSSNFDHNSNLVSPKDKADVAEVLGGAEISSAKITRYTWKLTTELQIEL
jgi:hypothetical protein